MLTLWDLCYYSIKIFMIFYPVSHLCSPLTRQELQGQLTISCPLEMQASCLTFTSPDTGGSSMLSPLNVLLMLEVGVLASAPSLLATKVHSFVSFKPWCLSDLLWRSLTYHQKLDRQFFFWVSFLPGYLVVTACGSVWGANPAHRRAATLVHCLLRLHSPNIWRSSDCNCWRSCYCC